MSGNTTLERCFKEAEETGRLNLSQKNLRDFPDPTDDCELIDVIEIGELSKSFISCKYCHCVKIKNTISRLQLDSMSDCLQ